MRPRAKEVTEVGGDEVVEGHRGKRETYKNRGTEAKRDGGFKEKE